MSDLKAASPEEPQRADAALDLVEISRSEIASRLAGQTPSAAQLASVGKSLGITAAEVAALAAGTADLRMTQAQYAELKIKLSRQYSQVMAAGAKKVVSRAHFNTFLVHTDKVTYKVQVSVIWTFDSAATTDPRPTMTTEGGGATKELPSIIRSKFHAQYPGFNSIK